ncbi:MAG TPA: amidohydrolase family protein [Rhizomicrobium sp.]|jgi:imidazolonepropionase-like amidohydrolase|nr:amidohydrolase family protein [Rhizomicrobium sp.]
MLKATLAVVALAGLLTSLCAAGANPAQLTIYRGAELIDGTGGTAKPDTAIIVESERIRAIVPDSTAANYADGARVVDVHGLYAIPGLIDSHVHLATSPNRRYAEALLRRDVYSGVTTVRDMAGDARLLADLARGALLGEIPAPDIYYAALMAGPEFFKDPRTAAAARGAVPGGVPWMRAINAATDLKLAVAEAHGTGATAIKIYADLPGDLVRNITAEAHRQNMLVWAHAAVFPASPREVIDAGVDVISHACMLAYQASEHMPPAYHNRASVEENKFVGHNPALDGLFADMKQHGTILDATLYVYDAMWREANAQSPPYCTLALAEKITEQAHRAGISISTGTDDPGDWHDPYPSLDEELSLLVHHAGFSPMEAIIAATRIGAMTVGQEKEMGTLEPGKLADIAFLAKDPLSEIGNVKSVTMTVKRGVLYRRSDYRPITKDEAQGDF